MSSEKKSGTIDQAGAKSAPKVASTVMPHIDETRSELKVKSKKSKKLVLDEGSFKTPRTRGELYNELVKEERQKTEEDFYEFAPLASRAIASIVDAILIFFLVEAGIFFAPYEVQFAQYIFFKLDLGNLFSDEFMLQGAIIMGTGFLLMAFTVIPLAFFNCSLGKKLMSLRLRGDEVYTLSIGQCIQREYILKPLSTVLIVGLVMPFFDKKKQSLHDKIAKTLVIKDN